jgi:hypothetical protein
MDWSIALKVSGSPVGFMAASIPLGSNDNFVGIPAGIW